MNKTILIVDDDDDDKALFREAINEIDKSIQCFSVNNGQDALNFLESKPDLPDFIFLDLNMPRLNGIQFLGEIKKKPEWLRIPVIIYSTTKRLEDVNETRKLGAVHFFTKPTIFTEICKSIIFVLAQNWDKQISFPN